MTHLFSSLVLFAEQCRSARTRAKQTRFRSSKALPREFRIRIAARCIPDPGAGRHRSVFAGTPSVPPRRASRTIQRTGPPVKALPVSAQTPLFIMQLHFTCHRRMKQSPGHRVTGSPRGCVDCLMNRCARPLLPMIR